MFRMSAPYPTPIVTCLFPTPDYNDPIEGQSEIVKHVSINGTKRVFVIVDPKEKFTLTWKPLSPLKKEEMFEFLKAYHASEFIIQMPWKLDVLWKATLITNPWTGVQNKRATESIELSFEGIPLV